VPADRSDPDEPAPGWPVIDCHCHAGTGDGLTGPWDTSAPLHDYRRRAAAAGIDATVLFAPFSSDYAAANRQVAEIVRTDPARFLGFAFVHPERDRGRMDAILTEAVGVHGFVGVKAHRHDGAARERGFSCARTVPWSALRGSTYTVRLPTRERGTPIPASFAHSSTGMACRHTDSSASEGRR